MILTSRVERCSRFRVSIHLRSREHSPKVGIREIEGRPGLLRARSETMMVTSCQFMKGRDELDCRHLAGRGDDHVLVVPYTIVGAP
jgi:hypothetical protein